MIIPRNNHLEEAQLREIEQIVGEYGCRIQVIVGEGRSIYAILGDERHETMLNRLMGLDYIDRVDSIDSPFKLMDCRSQLASVQFRVGDIVCGEQPLFIAGQCTIDPDNPQLFLETAQAVKEAGANALRGGVWKPRTMPYSFQGDDRSLDTLLEARAATGLPVVTEVMDPDQLERAVAAGVDVVQIGTRNALNYPLLRKAGELSAAAGTAVLLKRCRAMAPVDEFIAAAEYIAAGGNSRILLCPRGTLPALDGYRNHPDESITPLLKDKTWAPVIVDPSHSVGRAVYVPGAALAAMAYGADGLVIEAHVDPRRGIGDDPKQSLEPSALKRLLRDATGIWEICRHYRHNRDTVGMLSS